MKLPLKPGTGAGQLVDADGLLMGIMGYHYADRTDFYEDCVVALEVAKRVNLHDELVASLSELLGVNRTQGVTDVEYETVESRANAVLDKVSS